jgi:hypothetical protein
MLSLIFRQDAGKRNIDEVIQKSIEEIKRIVESSVNKESKEIQSNKVKNDNIICKIIHFAIILHKA